MSQINTLFISYRRADNPIFVERIRDWLIARYQRDRVFMDFDSIPSFTRFQTFIEKKIAASDAVIVIIGPEWLNLLKEKESSGEIDYVRIEIESALKLNKVIAPIRILDAPAPRPADLPPSLRPLCEINAPVLNTGTHFLDNIERLIADLEAAYGEHVTSEAERLAKQYIDSANTRFEAGDYEGAIADATEAVRLKPDYAAAYRRRAGARVRSGDYDGAIADANEAIRLKPDYADAYFNRGSARDKKGDFDGAIADYTEAMHLNPDDPYVYNNRAGVRGVIGDNDGARASKDDSDGAIADATEVIRLKPNYADAYILRGLMRREKRDITGAITDWQVAIRLGAPNRAQLEQWIAGLEQESY